MSPNEAQQKHAFASVDLPVGGLIRPKYAFPI